VLVRPAQKREVQEMAQATSYPARFDVDYPGQMDRLTTLLRLIWAIPILIVLALLSGPTNSHVVDRAGETVQTGGGGFAAGLFLATVLMIVFRQRYPRWWFDFALELARFGARVGAYVLLLTDRYPSTVDAQSVHLDVAYPDTEQDLNRHLPLVKWLLALPHYIALAVLAIAVIVVTVIAWFAILFTGTYPRGMFDFVVGVGRWATRVWAYAFLLVTDVYPPFSME
jgi:Domain of unknown function (DUF4389)